MHKISLVVITYNEEKNILRCLDSVHGLVDEIVIVDSFSTDKTKELCLSRVDKFIENPFEGHIQQKNFALKQASYDFILSLDADEAVDNVLYEEIKALKQNKTAEAYVLNRLTNYCGKWIKHGNWYPDKKVRLINRQIGEWGGLNPHDKIVLQNNIKPIELKGHLLHYTFYTFEEHLKQIKRFTDISSKAAFEKGKKGSLYKIILNPLAKFLGAFVMRLGFLDGYTGFRIAWYSAYATYLKYSKLRKLQQQY